MTLEQLKDSADALDAGERAELAEYLLESLSPSHGDVTDEWLAVAERRMADVRAGRVQGVPAEQVLGSRLEP